jgi:Ni/Co efflux regulator RcnB
MCQEAHLALGEDIFIQQKKLNPRPAGCPHCHPGPTVAALVPPPTTAAACNTTTTARRCRHRHHHNNHRHRHNNHRHATTTTTRATRHRSAVHHHPAVAVATCGSNREERYEIGVEGWGRGENLEPSARGCGHAEEPHRGKMDAAPSGSEGGGDARREAARGRI